MAKYKIVFDGVEEDEIYETEEEAEYYALEMCSNDRLGAEILHMSNPGDYYYDEDEYESPDYEIIEIDDEEDEYEEKGEEYCSKKEGAIEKTLLIGGVIIGAVALGKFIKNKFFSKQRKTK